MNRLFILVASLLFAAVAAVASNIPMISGPLDPGAAVANNNALTQRINFGVSGLLGSLTTSFTSSGTSKQAAFAVTLPTWPTPSISQTGGQLDQNGQIFHEHATGVNSADANAKTVTFDFGAISCALTVTGSAATWVADFWVTKTGASTQAYHCLGREGTSTLAVVQGTGTVTDTASINADVSVTAATSGTMTVSQAWADQIK